MNSPKQDTGKTFEQSMQELESIVQRMEQGDLPLEEALAAFEQGIKLAKSSQAALKQAEQKVQVLMQQDGAEYLQDFADQQQEQ